MEKIIFVFLFLFIFLPLQQIWAAGLVPCGGYGEAPCTFCHFFAMFNNVVRLLLFSLVPIIAVLMLVIGGVMFFFAGVKPSILIRAKGIITSVVIGLLIIFCAWVIVNTVLNYSGIVSFPSLLQWYKIDCSIK